MREIYLTLIVFMTLGLFFARFDSVNEATLVNCQDAPFAYAAAGEWSEAGHIYRCAKKGEKANTVYIFYQDAIIR